MGRVVPSGLKRILMEVEHVKAHRTKKEKKEMSHFEKFVTEGNETADELAKAGALMDEGFICGRKGENSAAREREEVYAAFSTQPAFTVWWKNGKVVKFYLKPKPKETLIFSIDA